MVEFDDRAAYVQTHAHALVLGAEKRFEQLGLRQDDIINSVNGKPVRNGEEALGAYQALASTTQFRIGVLRGGSNINLNFSVQ